MRFTDYDPMAWLYATRWGSEYHEQGYAILNRLLLSQLPRGARILDLCCGDGRIAQQMSLAGLEVAGIDGSERMLEFARERAPGVPFIAGDARDFAVDRPFDAAISTFDALNHVMSSEEMEQVCCSVARALAPGGAFVFDLNREDAYTTFWSSTSAIVEPDVVNVCAGGYDRARRVAHSDFTLFRLRSGEWQRSDFRMTQYCHRETDVVKSLYAAGFAAVSVFDASDDLGMSGNIGKGRDFYFARKGT